MTGQTVDAIVEQIQEAKGLKGVREAVVPMLKKLEKTSTKTASVLEGKLTDGTDPLLVLDPAVHSAGYLFILNARLGVTELDLDELVPFVLTFTENADPAQMRLIPDQVNFFGKQFAYVARDYHQPTLAILPLLTMISRFADQGHLTAMHPLLLQVIMYTRQYASVKDLLLQDIVDLDSGLGPLKYQDNLLYHYLGGVIMSLLGEYTRAMDMLEIVVSSPGTLAAAIQVDAYKKLLLMQLLATGQTQPLPRYTSGPVSTACKQLCGPYIEYATAYSAQDKATVVAILQQYRETFEQDLNSGLIALCGRAFRRRTIQKLTATYMTLSLVEIAKALDLPADTDSLKEVQSEIESMMAKGEIHGSISSSMTGNLSDVTVTFIDDPEPYNSHATVSRVTQAIEKAKLLDQSIIARDLALERSMEYVQKAYAAAGSTMGAAPGGPGGLAFGGGEFAGFGAGRMGAMEDFDFRSPGGRRGSDAGGSAGAEWEELDED